MKWKVPDGTRGHPKAYAESLDSEKGALGVKWEFMQKLRVSAVLESWRCIEEPWVILKVQTVEWGSQVSKAGVHSCIKGSEL